LFWFNDNLSNFSVKRKENWKERPWYQERNYLKEKIKDQGRGEKQETAKRLSTDSFS
jgi:hypothetical protein